MRVTMSRTPSIATDVLVQSVKRDDGERRRVRGTRNGIKGSRTLGVGDIVNSVAVLQCFDHPANNYLCAGWDGIDRDELVRSPRLLWRITRHDLIAGRT